jgi:hypothetical protein
MGGDYSSIEATSCLLAGASASYLSKHLTRRFKLSHSTQTLVMLAVFLAAFLIVGGGFEYFRQ